MPDKFILVSNYTPKGDQPKAINQLTENILKGVKYQTLLGVTGSGKTFTIANVIANVNKPTLIISHNKTLAAQLYGELKQLFPYNAVEYFISYYDYYQPEAYIPERDLYIAKEATINDDIERLRLRTLSSLLSRRDVIVVASVSCIYSFGNPDEVKKLYIPIQVGQEIEREELLKKLVELQYKRNDFQLQRGTFRIRGEIIELIPAYEEFKVRIEFFDNEIERITIRNPLTNEIIEELDNIVIYPGAFFITTKPTLERAIKSILEELDKQIEYFRNRKDLSEEERILRAERLRRRVLYDVELLKEVGYCPGIENYSRHLDGRLPGQRPWCLIDYFPEDFLLIIDESHVTIPQLQGMYRGDRARKETLVEYGFRLPSALDNRPLKFEELEKLWNQVIFMSATPGKYEIEKSKPHIVEQIIRPTGLVDPEIVVRPKEKQIDDLMEEIRKRRQKGEKVIVNTLTKRMAEEVAEFLLKHGIKARYMHSELDAFERVEALRDLRLGEIDVLVGVNLLREGLDLPEVSLVVILDADKTGFLRSETSLIQLAG